MDTYINGEMRSADKALISATDAGFMHGVGLFETMAAHNGTVFRLDEHLKRISKSASELGLAANLDKAALKKAIQKTIAHNSITEARIRLTVTPGSISLLSGKQNEAPKPSVIISASEPTVYDSSYFEKGITAVIAGPGANPFDSNAGHKTLNYWPRLRSLRQAAAKGAGEAIWLNVSNHLAGGSISNIFLVKDSALFTPIAHGEEIKEALPAPVLPGITRAAVLKIAKQMDIKFTKKMLTVNELLEADEVFLTNSSWQILPVSAIEKKQIKEAKAGKITTSLRHKLLEVVKDETNCM